MPAQRKDRPRSTAGKDREFETLLRRAVAFLRKAVWSVEGREKEGYRKLIDFGDIKEDKKHVTSYRSSVKATSRESAFYLRK